MLLSLISSPLSFSPTSIWSQLSVPRLFFWSLFCNLQCHTSSICVILFSFTVNVSCWLSYVVKLLLYTHWLNKCIPADSSKLSRNQSLAVYSREKPNTANGVDVKRKWTVRNTGCWKSGENNNSNVPFKLGQWEQFQNWNLLRKWKQNRNSRIKHISKCSFPSALSMTIIEDKCVVMV